MGLERVDTERIFVGEERQYVLQRSTGELAWSSASISWTAL
ncbi:hypothetical protein ACFC1L_26775 [Streptomyces sp. NPDC056210]